MSLSVRALLLTVVSFASFLTIEHPVEDYARIFKLSERDVIARRIASLTNLTDVQMAVPRVTLRELSGYVLPSVAATFVLGAVLGFPSVHHEQLLAIVGTALIGGGHAIGLYKLDEALAGRPLPPPGSYERICTSPLGRLNNEGVHVHVMDDSTTNSYQPDSNEADNRGSGGKFEGDGASSQW